MTVSVNNQPREFPEHTTVMQLIQAMGINAFNGMAIAVNNTIVRKEEWESHYLRLNDAIVLIRASQGG